MKDDRLSFYKRNRLIIWAIMCSIVAALVIQILFSINAPCDLLAAKWTAGDILTYIGTVSLGVIALWQNKIFKEENDNAQKRLENITTRANEISIINKVIEFETSQLQELKNASDEFSYACDSQTIGIKYGENITDNIKISIMATQLEQNIDKSFFRLCRCMRIDPDIQSKIPEDSSLAEYYLKAKDVVGKLKSNPIQKDQDIEELADKRNLFIKERELYIQKKEKKIYALLYENLSLDEILSMQKNINDEETSVFKS